MPDDNGFNWASLISPGLGVIGGGLQAIFGGGAARKAQKQLEDLKTPTYTESPGVKDYYMQALGRYGINPYQSSQYQNDITQVNRNQAAGVSALQDRRSAVAGVGRLAALSNQGAINAGNAATQEQDQRFAQVGQGAEMQSQQDQLGYQYNQLLPYQKQLQLLSMKAGANAQTENTGLSNIFGGLSNASQIFGDYQNNKIPKQQSITANQLGYQ